MTHCPICKRQIEGWQALCEECWHRAEESYKLEKLENGELIERLKGRAKENLLDLLREVCRHCSKFSLDVTDPTCSNCIFKEKEKLIRAFLE